MESIRLIWEVGATEVAPVRHIRFVKLSLEGLFRLLGHLLVDHWCV